MINAKLLQLVVDASNDGIVVAEQEGEDNILIYANAAFERLTGYSCDDILYQDCRFLQAGDRAQIACRPFVMQSGRAGPAGRSSATIARMAVRSGTSCRSPRCTTRATS
jgi:PAS domain-containing protein